jgi:glycosyltransferase involved in cell wall biosynthesis
MIDGQSQFQAKVENLTVSVIVPAYNCEKTIAETVHGLLKQNYPIKEIIIVDDGSTDNTLDVIRSFSQLTFVHQKNAGPASARNRGARLADSNIIFFTDSDCIPHEDWVEKSVHHFKNNSIAAVAGSYGIANHGELLARCIQKEISFRHIHLMPEHIKCFGSYNVAIRRDIFNQLGGFNENYRRASGEDNDLSYKILKQGHIIFFEKESLVDHYHTAHILKYWKEQFRHGFWRVKMYYDHPQMTQGDDYTFWKDIIEVPWVYINCVLMIIFVKLFFMSIFAMLIFETIFAFRILRNVSESLFFGPVMLGRAVARSFGFLYGFLNFLPNFFQKKSK